MSTFTRRLHVARGAETLHGIRFGVATSLAHSATNYWTMTVLRREAAKGLKPKDTFGKVVGTPFTTKTFDLTAGVLVTIYGTEGGLALADGDELWATQVSTGSPALLDGPAFDVEVS